ncbi:hypothetical protein ACSSKO_17940, partial [Escherichia coli]|uniref:hypothetical protein n=1 Tax=Escherichia coli TaxID=562 RepID=UPI003FD67907
SHWSTSKTPSYTKSVSWQHHPRRFPGYFCSSANDTFFRKQARVLHFLYPADIPLSTALF